MKLGRVAAAQLRQKRLQQACGLTCKMKFASGNKKVIVCVRADADDLAAPLTALASAPKPPAGKAAEKAKGAVKETEALAPNRTEHGCVVTRHEALRLLA